MIQLKQINWQLNALESNICVSALLNQTTWHYRLLIFGKLAFFFDPMVFYGHLALFWHFDTEKFRFLKKYLFWKKR